MSYISFSQVRAWLKPAPHWLCLISPSIPVRKPFLFLLLGRPRKQYLDSLVEIPMFIALVELSLVLSWIALLLERQSEVAQGARIDEEGEIPVVIVSRRL